MRRLDERGETLVEVVMALGILSLVLVSSYALATGTFRLGRGAGDRTQAVNSLQQQAEALRTYRDEVIWQTQFAVAMTAYTQAPPFDTFCMVKKVESGIQRWRPIAASDVACTVNGVKLSIHPTPVGTPASQYNFDFKAVWTTSSKENNVTLTTKLTDQTP